MEYYYLKTQQHSVFCYNCLKDGRKEVKVISVKVAYHAWKYEHTLYSEIIALSSYLHSLYTFSVVSDKDERKSCKDSLLV